MKVCTLVLTAFVSAAASVALTACSNAPCRHLRNPELAAVTSPDGGTDASGGTSSQTSSADRSSTGDSKAVKNSDRVFVSKPDGSLQCGMGKGIEPDVMKKELKNIEVFSATKQDDGKMHMQLCGSPTGKLNVFEIPANSLAAAVKLGFSKFESAK